MVRAGHRTRSSILRWLVDHELRVTLPEGLHNPVDCLRDRRSCRDSDGSLVCCLNTMSQARSFHTMSLLRFRHLFALGDLNDMSGRSIYGRETVTASRSRSLM